MRHPNIIVIISIVFVMTMTCRMVPARQVIPGALLNLDASTQNNRDKAWKNLGLAGKEIPADGKTPDLKNGRIRIPALGMDEEMEWYTAGSGQHFFGPVGTTPQLKLKDWTLEYLVRRNGPKFEGNVVAAEFGGFQARERDLQRFRISMAGPDTGEIIVWMKGKNNEKGAWFAGEDLGVDLGEKEWHWLAFVFTSGETLVSYQDGKMVGTAETDQAFDNTESMRVSIFSSGDQNRNYNGSFAIVRIYDRPFTESEINQNAIGILPVEPADSIATTWGQVKTSYSPHR